MLWSVVLLVAQVAAQTEEALTQALKVEQELQDLVRRVSAAYCAIGSGSGVCIRPDGLIVTNQHVAGDRERWVVYFGDGRPPLWARKLGQDDRGDLCLLQVEGKHTDLPSLPLGDSRALKVGDQVLALGNPWILSQDGRPTVTVGVISGLHYNQGGYTDAIVTDCAINPGNSGGPLVNMRGEVVGINGRIATRFENRVNTGVGFAIPSAQIKNFLDSLAQARITWHGALRGVEAATSSDPPGVRVFPGRLVPAFKEGLRYGDVVTHVNGIPVTTESRFWGLLATYPAGTRVELRVVREGKPLTVHITLSSVEPPEHGIVLEPAGDGSGRLTLQVRQVVPGSAAERAGLRRGDRITYLEGVPLRDGDQLMRLLDYYYPGKALRMAVERGDRSLLLTLVLGGARDGA